MFFFNKITRNLVHKIQFVSKFSKRNILNILDFKTIQFFDTKFSLKKNTRNLNDRNAIKTLRFKKKEYFLIDILFNQFQFDSLKKSESIFKIFKLFSFHPFSFIIFNFICFNKFRIVKHYF